MRVFPAVRSSLLVLGVALALSACNPPEADKAQKDASTNAMVSADTAVGDFAGIKAASRKLFGGKEPDLVEESPIKGLYEVYTGGRVFYASPDGKYFMQGDMIDTTAADPMNASETRKALDKNRAVIDAQIMAVNGPLMKQIDLKDSITFKAKGEQKAELYVFTDTDCGYCRKMHQEIGQINAQGITVHYLPWPRSGKQGPTYDTMKAVWCATDKQKALTTAKNGGTVKPASCNDPVDKYVDLGHALSVSGTPAVFTSEGKQIGGYIEASQLPGLLFPAAASGK